MKKMLLVIDCQKAFINSYTEKYIKKINDLIKNSDYIMHEAFCLDSEENIFKPYEKHHSTVKSACEKMNNLNIKNLILYYTEETHIENRKKLYFEEGKKYFSNNILIPN